MITSNSNQYLAPDYFSSLPTTLDAKKSPLALLAQTCSQIGSDSPSAKLLLSPNDKLTKTNREKSSPSSTSSGPSPTATKSSFKPYESCLKDHLDDKHQQTERKSSPSKHSSQNGSLSSPHVSPAASVSSSSRPLSNPSISSPLSLKGDSSLKLTSPSSNYMPLYPPSLSADVMASSLLSNPLKSSLNPYLNYARMKGIDGLAPGVCRDPFCASCQLSSHLLAAAVAQNGKACPPGCTQCDVKSNGFMASNHFAVAYAQAQLAALAAASQMPYVCSWVGSDAAYCGKKFITSEELLQHLRTHTSDTLGSPASHLLNRNYPSSPISPLSNRYHPYSKPPFLPPSLFSATSGAIHPAFSPYLMYGSKLGSPHH